MSHSRLQWNNLFADVTATITASAEDAGFPVENLATWRETAEVWEASGANNYVIDLEFATPKPASSVALVGHNLYTCGARFKVEGYDAIPSSAPAYHLLMDYVTPASDFCLSEFFTQASYTGYRITINNNGGANFSPRIGIAFLGTYLEFEHSPDAPSDPDQQEDVGETERSGTGYALGSTLLYTKRHQTWTFGHLTPAWYKSDFLPFWSSHRRKPFIFTWNPEGYPLEAYLLQFTKDILNAPYQDVLRRSLDLEMEGVLEE